MNKRKLLALVLTGVMAISTLAGCGSSDTKTSDTDVKTSETAETSDKNVLRVGMECAYAPFNWTQDSDTTPDGSKAVPIYGSDYYAYGYDVAVAQYVPESAPLIWASVKAHGQWECRHLRQCCMWYCHRHLKILSRRWQIHS